MVGIFDQPPVCEVLQVLKCNPRTTTGLLFVNHPSEFDNCRYQSAGSIPRRWSRRSVPQPDGLAGYMPDDITRTETLFMMLSNLGINPSMDKLARSHVPRLIFEEMVVHAGFCPLTED